MHWWVESARKKCTCGNYNYPCLQLNIKICQVLLLHLTACSASILLQTILKIHWYCIEMYGVGRQHVHILLFLPTFVYVTI